MPKAEVQIVVTGGKRATDSLRGITKRSAASARAQESQSKRLAGSQVRIEQAKHNRIRQFDKEHLRAVRSSTREQERLSRRLARARERDAKRAADTAIREQRRASRSRLGAAAVAGIGAGIASGVNQAYSLRSSVAGVKSREEEVVSAAEFDLNLRRLSGQAGLDTAGRERLQETILGTSTRYGFDQNQLLTGVAEAQERFGTEGFENLMQILPEMAQASMALGVPLADIVGMMGTFSDRMDVKGTEDMLEALYFTTQAARDGAIEIKGFSKEFAGEVGSFAQLMGASGIKGVRTFVGTAQAIGAGQFGEAESATRLRATAIALSAGPTRDELTKFLRKDRSTRGLSKTLQKGGMPEMETLVTALAGREDFSGSKVAQIFSETRALSGILSLVSAERAGSTAALSNISRASAPEGKALVQNLAKDLESSPAIQFMRLAAESQAQVTRELPKYTQQIIDSTKLINDMNERMGGSIFALKSLRDAAMAAAGALALRSILGGTGGGGAPGTLAKAMPTFAKWTGAAKGGLAALFGTKVMAAGTAGATAGAIGAGLLPGIGLHFLLKKHGGDKAIEDWFHGLGGSPLEDANKRLAAEEKARQEARDQAKRQLQATQATTRAIENMKETESKAKRGDARSQSPKREN